ncbi:MAG: nitroreductase family protein [Thermoplasmata archaeon]|nr:nitroreductase family protein [Thermoplasmata archaeon]
MIMEVIKKRRSVRRYSSQDIREEVLKEILEAARLAPSAKNLQAWKFIVVRDKATKERLAEAAKGQWFMAEAPVIIAGVATYPEYVMTNGVPACHIDLAIAMEHIALAAAEKGIGTCWIGAFYQDRVKRILGVPDECMVVALMPLGYPVDALVEEEKDRKSMDEIVYWERYC